MSSVKLQEFYVSVATRNYAEAMSYVRAGGVIVYNSELARAVACGCLKTYRKGISARKGCVTESVLEYDVISVDNSEGPTAYGDSSTYISVGNEYVVSVKNVVVIGNADVNAVLIVDVHRSVGALEGRLDNAPDYRVNISCLACYLVALVKLILHAVLTYNVDAYAGYLVLSDVGSGACALIFNTDSRSTAEIIKARKHEALLCTAIRKREAVAAVPLNEGLVKRRLLYLEGNLLIGKSRAAGKQVVLATLKLKNYGIYAGLNSTRNAGGLNLVLDKVVLIAYEVKDVVNRTVKVVRGDRPIQVIGGDGARRDVYVELIITPVCNTVNVNGEAKLILTAVGHVLKGELCTVGHGSVTVTCLNVPGNGSVVCVIHT